MSHMGLTDSNWSSTDFNWNEICVAHAVVTFCTYKVVDSEQFNSRLRRQTKKDQKTFIKLLCKIKGEEEYEQTKYFRPNIHVKARRF